jgi:hypothetical protein
MATKTFVAASFVYASDNYKASDGSTTPAVFVSDLAAAGGGASYCTVIGNNVFVRMGLEQQSGNPGTITSITFYASAKRTSTSYWASCYMQILTHANAYNSASLGSGSNSFATYSNAWATNPFTSAAWTWDEFNAVSMFFSTTSGGSTYQVYQDYLYAIVTYTPAPVATGNFFPFLLNNR